MRFSLDFMLGFLGARLGFGLFMEVIMVHPTPEFTDFMGKNRIQSQDFVQLSADSPSRAAFVEKMTEAQQSRGVLGKSQPCHPNRSRRLTAAILVIQTFWLGKCHMIKFSTTFHLLRQTISIGKPILTGHLNDTIKQ